MLDEPTVRPTKRKRRQKRRRPKDSVVVTVPIDDAADGTKEVSFASPDGVNWKAHAYWTNSPTETYRIVVDDEGRPVAGVLAEQDED